MAQRPATLPVEDYGDRLLARQALEGGHKASNNRGPFQRK